MNIQELKKKIRNIPNFPKKGIQYKDITTVLENYDAFKYSIDFFYDKFVNKEIDTVVGIESRGFIFGAPLALRLKKGFVLARKPNKLPAKKISKSYKLEYGMDSIEMHADSINENDKVLIVDDLLATGGTAKAVGELVSELGGKIQSYAFLIELKGLNGSKELHPNNVFSLIDF